MNSAESAVPALSALRCWVNGRRIYLEINDRRSISFPATKYASLSNASQADLQQVELQVGGRAIHWASIDEEIQVDDVAHNRFFHTAKPAVAQVG